MEERLGLDCGDTIFYTASGRMVPDAIPSIRKIVAANRFADIFVVSKVNPLSKRIFLLRLWRRNFWKRTGIPRDHLVFCRRNKDKAAICERLGITHFVDDRLEVLHHLGSVQQRYALRPRRKRERERYKETLSRVTVVRSWKELLPALLGTRPISGA